MRRHAAVSVGDQEYMRAEATGIMRLGTVTPGAALVNRRSQRAESVSIVRRRGGRPTATARGARPPAVAARAGRVERRRRSVLRRRGGGPAPGPGPGVGR